jgi:hypothetical protein
VPALNRIESTRDNGVWHASDAERRGFGLKCGCGHSSTRGRGIVKPFCYNLPLRRCKPSFPCPERPYITSGYMSPRQNTLLPGAWFTKVTGDLDLHLGLADGRNLYDGRALQTIFYIHPHLIQIIVGLAFPKPLGNGCGSRPALYLLNLVSVSVVFVI